MSYKYLDLTGLSHFWEKIKTKFALKADSVEFIVGTQSSSTATHLWKGKTKDTALYEGKMISYYLPNSPDGYEVTLNLSTSDGTSLGAKSVYYAGSTKLVSQYATGSIVYMVYRNNAWHCLADNNTSDVYNNQLNSYIVAGTAGIHIKSICALDSDGNFQSFTTTGGTGTSKAVNTAKFKNPMVIYVSPSTTSYASGSVLLRPYTTTVASLNYSFNNASSLVANTPVYIECTKTSDGLFQLSNNILVQSGFVQGNYYVYLGITGNSTRTNCAISEAHPVYYYDGTNLVSENKSKQDKLTAGSNIQITNNTISATDTKYSSKAAASGGTDVSLVTTGEKYTWNNKTSNTGTVTSVAVKMNGATKGTVTTSGTIDLGTVITAHQDISGKQDKLTTQTAYSAKGTSTKVPQITTNSLGQVTNITEVDIEGGSGLVAYSSIPIGGGCDYYGTVLPDGFMWADGSAISRTTYAELFAVIGTTYGAGDGSTTFNLPDKRERVSVMKKEGGTFDTLGKTGGEEKHKLTNSELSSHGHQVRIWNNAGNGSTSPARTFNSNGDQTTSSLGVQFRSVNVSGVNSSTWVSSRIVAAQGGIGDQAASADKAGGDQAHNNLQPYFVCNYIIRVLNISTTMSATTKDIAAVKSEILADLYPVGSIYMSINNTNPSTMFGGTWEQLKDRFLLGAGDTYTAGNTGGEAKHQLTKAELPNYTLYNASHSHTIFTYRNGAGNGAIINGQQDNYNVKTGTFSQINGTTIKVDSGGSNTPHNNMPPYLAVYMWKRTA